ncbi:BtpA/SgcQ family protein [Ichthyenterobacterium magnum]|uniref:BtpA family membrane complex biogenesis protein n=1 Tax=Ichthyenterobacterium magnum TaxID=1230530 RepID=A0A420DMA8_9FLAO|nr:BtpA/SgcQ family protein [Ichthyenterobacterium magnum]RKE95382.1 hypothetical protein BXY80_1569 [Ichthyenterobacterium magnum]
MEKFKSIFKVKNPIIGMIHVQALPGTPKHKYTIKQVIEMALEEARVYKKAGIDAILIENMHDIPYIKNGVGHEISSIMSLVAYLIKQETNLPIGMQILAGANKEALAAAQTASIDFIRAEGFVFGHVADEGYIDAQAGELLRYQKQISATSIAIFTDIKKKHSSHAITQDVSLLDTAKAAAFFLTDGLIVTGSHTGHSASINDLNHLKDNIDSPIIIGSGITIENISNYLPLCDAMIVGSHFKKQGHWDNDLSYDRVAEFMSLVNQLR